MKVLEQINGFDEYNLLVEKPQIIRSYRMDDWGRVFNYNSNRVEDRSQIGAWINQVVMTCQFNNDDDFNLGVEKFSEGINAWRTQFYERTSILNKSSIDLPDMDYFERLRKATGFELYNEQDYSKVQIKSIHLLAAVMQQIEECLIPD